MALTRINNQALPTIDHSNMPSGSVLQVKQATSTGAFTINTNDTWTDLTDLSVAITPKSTSSKILVTVNVTGADDTNSYVRVRLLRGSTAIAVGDSASGHESTFSLHGHTSAGNAEQQVGSMTWLDSPATTSATTYKLQGSCYNSRIARFNYNNGDSNTRQNTVSTITVMEIAG